MNDTIQHHGVKGMKWGQRNRVEHLTNRYMSKGYDQNTAYQKAVRRSNVERKLKKAAIVGGVALAAYAGYKGANYLMAKRKWMLLNLGLDTMNQIRESNMLPKKGKMDKIREASRKLKDKTRDIRMNNTNKIKEASKKITDRVKEAHRKDTERFARRMKEAMEAEAARKAQKEISTNFKNINKKAKKQTTAIDIANSDALKLFKELSK